MKKIFVFTIVLIIVSCTNPSSPKNELTILIEEYQNYGGNRAEKTPLGDYRESRYEKYAAFCDSLKTKLEAIEKNSLEEDDQLSYDLLTSN